MPARTTGQRKEYRIFDLDEVTIEPGFNVRIESPELEAHILWLRDSIIEEGVKTPLQGRWDKDSSKVVIFDGHCRYQAALMAREMGHQIKLPIILQDKYSNEGDRIAAMLIANSGLELKPLEKAEVCKRLHRYGWSVDRIAKAYKPAITRAHVENLLELSSASPEVQNMIKAGQVAATTAIHTIKQHGADEATKILSSAMAEAVELGRTKISNNDVLRHQLNNNADGTAAKPTPPSTPPIADTTAPLERIAKSLETYKSQPTLRKLLTELLDSEAKYLEDGKVHIAVDKDLWETLESVL